MFLPINRINKLHSVNGAVGFECFDQPTTARQSVVRCTLEKRRYFVTASSGKEQLPRVADLLLRQFVFPSEFDTSALRCFHAGAGPFADEAAL